MVKKFIEQKKLYAKHKKTSTKNYRAANSMHVLFRRRVLKWYFIQTFFLCLTQNAELFGKKKESCEKNIYAFNLYFN